MHTMANGFSCNDEVSSIIKKPLNQSNNNWNQNSKLLNGDYYRSNEIVCFIDEKFAAGPAVSFFKHCASL